MGGSIMQLLLMLLLPLGAVLLAAYRCVIIVGNLRPAAGMARSLVAPLSCSASA